MQEITFILPLVLLPGVALLIVSTSTRVGQLHDEVHRAGDRHSAAGLMDMRRRARLFRNALVGLYSCVGIFALTSLIGVSLELLAHSPEWLIVGLTSLGCAALLYAACQLVIEALLSNAIIEQHIQEMIGEHYNG